MTNISALLFLNIFSKSPNVLPKNWGKFPAPPELGEIGSKWAVSNESLALRVPSAVVPNEFNILLNSSHPDMRHVAIADVEAFEMDDRHLLTLPIDIEDTDPLFY